MVEAILYFPPGFHWGTATSAFQVEGGKVDNDWSLRQSDQRQPIIAHHPGNACEWVQGRWKEDLDRASSSGHNAIRISVEWARVEPSPGIWDDDAIEYYRELLMGAVSRGLSPMVSLHHFTNPIWFMEAGGWENDHAGDLFERYVRKTVSSLKEHARTWITFNEPNVYLFAGYVRGRFPPGIRDLNRALEATKNLTSSHAAGYHAIHEIQPDTSVGMVHQYRGMTPSIQRSPIHRALTRSRNRSFNELFPRTLHDGWIRIFGKKARIREASRTQDFYGLNYFTSERISIDPSNRIESFSKGTHDRSAGSSGTGVIANHPTGMFEALKYAKGFGLPIIVTGNGIDDASDEFRPQYLAEHLRQIWAAVSYNWNVRGYFHWTLVDSFEWNGGWSRRFGLWSMDPETQVRAKRRSADFFADICRSNGLSSESVATYAPEVVNELFPPDPQREFVNRWNQGSG